MSSPHDNSKERIAQVIAAYKRVPWPLWALVALLFAFMVYWDYHMATVQESGALGLFLNSLGYMLLGGMLLIPGGFAWLYGTDAVEAAEASSRPRDVE
ncbi:hypothetical protein [Salisaeta longa]|uniref:hypothetical protein n=1 Tax=Salisaeta longa TaxID=503170 RepID=UPI0003B3B37C|nr:hypothetical protein [Salisaeta longa]